MPQPTFRVRTSTLRGGDTIRGVTATGGTVIDLQAFDISDSGDFADLVGDLLLAAVDDDLAVDDAADLLTGIPLGASDASDSADVAALNSGALVQLAAFDTSASDDRATLQYAGSSLPIEVTVYSAASPPGSVANPNSSGRVHVVTGTTRTLLPGCDLSVPVTASITVTWDVWWSHENFNTFKRETVTLRRDTVNGAILATFSTSATTDGGDNSTGHQFEWSGQFIDSSPTTGRYVICIQEVAAGVGNPALTVIWSDTRIMIVSRPETMLDILEGARDARWFDPLNDVGNGSFLLAIDDSKATDANLAVGNIAVFRLHGVPRYAIAVESTTAVLASPDGAVAEYFEVKGRGLEALLSRAVQAPTGTDYGQVPAAAVLASAIDAANGGTRPVLPSNLAIGFQAATDSAGLPWQDSAPYLIAPGTNYLDLLRMLPAIGVDVTMTPQMLLLAYRDGLGSDRTAQVVFRQGRHFRGEVQRVNQGAQRMTRMWVEGRSGSVVQVFGDEADPRIGIREGYLKVTTTDEPSTLQAVGAQAIAESAAAANALPVALLHGQGEGEYEPFLDYGKGDRVVIDVPGQIHETSRIVSLTIAATSDGGYTVDLDLNSIYVEELARVKRQLDKALVGVGV